MDSWKLILNSDQINEIVNNIADKIDKAYGDNDIVLMCILKGAAYFTIELSNKLKTNHSLEFVQSKSYNGQKRNKNNIIYNFNPEKLIGKKIIIIDELLDSGHTLLNVKNELIKYIPKDDIITCVAMNKKFCSKDKEKICLANIVGIDVPDVWLVGYGLDHYEQYRNLKKVYAVPKINDEDKTLDDLIIFGS